MKWLFKRNLINSELCTFDANNFMIHVYELGFFFGVFLGIPPV